mgnify:CR=1 FL=1|tara:strand:+ start:111775 stop:112515 length:741 start_codon:yes stop_codon:yes gene_type:complete
MKLIIVHMWMLLFFPFQWQSEDVAQTEAFSGVADHTQWHQLLKKYVDSKGNVHYQAFKKDEKALDAYLASLAQSEPNATSSASEKLAYFINLYNAATVKLILENYPVKSIKDIKKPWDKEWIKVGTKLYSLGDIEHKILRKMNEPRIHFAINCASYSCPKLLNEAFVSSKLETQLQNATIDFINDPKRNVITSEKINISYIFKWFRGDFTENGSILNYIQSYSKIKIKDEAKMDFIDYDWRLNETK